MLPNVLQTSATDHVPVLAAEVRELLAVRARGDGHRCHLRRRRARLAAGRRPAEQREADRDRSRSRRPRVLRPAEEAIGSADAIPPRRLFARPRAARRQRSRGGRDPARPRCLVHADRPSGTRFLVHRGRAARHAHGPRRRRQRRGNRQRGRRTGPGDDLQALRRGTVCATDREGDRAAQEGAAVRTDRRSSRDDQGRHPCTCPLR